jgi:hypothetical protein
MSEPNHLYHQALSSNRKLLKENARLKAEVEELKRQPDPLMCYLYAAEMAKDDIKKLKAEVKRLTEENEQLQNRCDFLEGKQ